MFENHHTEESCNKIKNTRKKDIVKLEKKIQCMEKDIY